MHFKEKVKQKFVMRCAQCGYASSKSMTDSFSSWLFHEQLCACNESKVSKPMLISTVSDRVDDLNKFATEEKIDLGEQYEVLGVLGKGGTGTVYRTRDKSDGTIVAVKVLREDLILDKNISNRFEQEALSVSRLNHPNLVSVKTTGRSPSGGPFIVMEYFEGKNLAELIKERGHLSVSETVQITSQIAEAIDYAHAFGVIHRDIKPSNILLSQEGDQFIVKVVDFGIAKAMPDKQIESAQLTQTGEIFGSPAYMSPEQCLGEEIDERSDIYSLGCVMYEMLTGKSPFACDNPIQTVLKHVKDEPERFEIEFNHLQIQYPIEDIVFKCLLKDPAKRYQSISALEQGLKQLSGYPAGLARRFAAASIDALSGLAIFCVFAIFCGSIDAALRPWLQQCLASACVLSALPIYIALESFRQGAPGKRLMGLRVMDTNGQRPNWLKLSIRILILFAALCVADSVCLPLQLSMVLLGLIHSGPIRPIGGGWPISPGVLTAFLVYWLLIAFSKNNISPLDRLFDRIVARPNCLPNSKKYSPFPTRLQWALVPVAFASIAASIILMPMADDQLANLAIAQHRFPYRTVVYAIKNVAKGSPITPDAIQERRVPDYEIWADALSSKQEAEGRIADFEIDPEEKITSWKASLRKPVLYALRNIPAGKVIPADAVEVRKVRLYEVTDDELTSPKEAAGRITKYGLTAGQCVYKNTFSTPVAPSSQTRH